MSSTPVAEATVVDSKDGNSAPGNPSKNNQAQINASTGGPVKCFCPDCNKNVTTTVSHTNVSFKWYHMFSLCAMCCCKCCKKCCFFLPCCFPVAKDSTHTCPSCNGILGVKADNYDKPFEE
ncbi:hypothetical protein TrCOL_g11426 [Triparma columacea]|uniref:LITAF domain-containing protein n=1 Tax=Triparma columacea TaxID=722753 RepID=A0A9W7GQ46_9STRA|nr:hypothetical protein TrCOL_g11426 [Triparma columacea]